jgi:hypothetical protein
MLGNAAASRPPRLEVGMGVEGMEVWGGHAAAAHLLMQSCGMAQDEMFICLEAALHAAHAVLDQGQPQHSAQDVTLMSHALHALRRVLQATQHSPLWSIIVHDRTRDQVTSRGSGADDTRGEVKSRGKGGEEREAASNSQTLKTAQAWLEVVQRVMALTSQGAAGGWDGRTDFFFSNHKVAALRRSALEAARDLFLCCDPSAPGHSAVMSTCVGLLLGETSHVHDALSTVACLDCLRACIQPHDAACAADRPPQCDGGTGVVEDGADEDGALLLMRHHVRRTHVRWWLEQRPAHWHSVQASHGTEEPERGGRWEGGELGTAAATQNRESAQCRGATALGHIVEVVQARANDTRWEVRHAAVLLAAALHSAADASTLPPLSTMAPAAPASSPCSSSPNTVGVGVSVGVGVGGEGETDESKSEHSMEMKLVQVLYTALDDADAFVRAAVLKAVPAVPAVLCGGSGGSTCGPAWGPKFAAAFYDSESMVRRAAVSLVLDLLFAQHAQRSRRQMHDTHTCTHANTHMGLGGARDGASATHSSDESAAPQAVLCVPESPPAVLCVPQLLGETRAAAGGEPCAEGVEQGQRWCNLLARCLDDVDWEVGLR